MKSSLITLSLLSLITLATTGGCAHGLKHDPTANQGTINHVVLLTLKDPSETEQVLKDCKELLSQVPEVKTLWVGTPTDIGRGAEVDGNYNVGICVGFASLDDYRAYMKAPHHMEFGNRWRTSFSAQKIYDVKSEN